MANLLSSLPSGFRVPLHKNIINAIQRSGFIFKNTVIWDRTNIVNKIGIFGWPSNYITMGTTFEYILDFYKPNGIENKKNTNGDTSTKDLH